MIRDERNEIRRSDILDAMSVCIVADPGRDDDPDPDDFPPEPDPEA
jgi:hypothetical protein